MTNTTKIASLVVTAAYIDGISRRLENEDVTDEIRWDVGKLDAAYVKASQARLDAIRAAKDLRVAVTEWMSSSTALLDQYDHTADIVCSLESARTRYADAKRAIYGCLESLVAIGFVHREIFLVDATHSFV